MKKKKFYFTFIFFYTLSFVMSACSLIWGAEESPDMLKSAVETGLKSAVVTFDQSEQTEESSSVSKSNASKPKAKASNGSKSKSDASKSDATKKSKASGKPLVLIYHTHGTESYLPSKAGNYHTTKEKNTVRDVGNFLEKSLNEEGIAVIHDKTIHDNPSYDGSYDRSYNCIKKILDENPSIVCLIDLHRDAIAGDYLGDTKNVDGKTAATYSYVLSNTTETYGENKQFLKELNQTAQRDFDGFTGRVLERPYWYNQELCGKAILIEMGNNRNQIEEVRNTAWTFGKILAKTLTDE